jgi:peptidoglycan-associated lipoprotein
MNTGDPDGWVRLDKDALGFPTIYFAYNQDAIGTSETAKLDPVADYLAGHDGVGVIVEGHCDERGNDEYNRALGERRAISVKDYLIGVGVADGRIKTLSFGEDRPAVEGSDEAAWSKNRRAEVVPCQMP